MTTSNADDAIKNEVNRLVVPIVYDRWLNRKINESIIGPSAVNVSNTSAGRFALMLRESVAETGTEHGEAALKEFGKRIGSVKSDSTRREGERLLKLISDDAFLSITDKASEMLKFDLNRLGEDVKREEMLHRWPQYLMAILADRKYKGR